MSPATPIEDTFERNLPGDLAKVIHKTAIRDTAGLVQVPGTTRHEILYADGTHESVNVPVPRSHEFGSVESVAKYAIWLKSKMGNDPAIFVAGDKIVVVDEFASEESTRQSHGAMPLQLTDQFKSISGWNGEGSFFNQKLLQKMFRTKLRGVVEDTERVKWVERLGKIVTTSGIGQGELSIGNKAGSGEQWPDSFKVSCRVIDDRALDSEPTHSIDVVLDIEAGADGPRIYLTAITTQLKQAIDSELSKLSKILEAQVAEAEIPVYVGRP